MDGTKGVVKVGYCPRYVSSLGQLLLQTDTPMADSILIHCRLMGEAVEHIPQSVPPSFSPLSFLLRLLLLLYVVRGLHSAKATAASPSARQGLVFWGQTAKFSDGYWFTPSPHVSNSSSSPPPAQHGLRPLHEVLKVRYLRKENHGGPLFPVNVLQNNGTLLKSVRVHFAAGSKALRDTQTGMRREILMWIAFFWACLTRKKIQHSTS